MLFALRYSQCNLDFLVDGVNASQWILVFVYQNNLLQDLYTFPYGLVNSRRFVIFHEPLQLLLAFFLCVRQYGDKVLQDSSLIPEQNELLQLMLTSTIYFRFWFSKIYVFLHLDYSQEPIRPTNTN